MLQLRAQATCTLWLMDFTVHTNQTKPLEYFWNLSKITQVHSVPNSEIYTTRSLGAHSTCTHMHAVKCVLNCFTNCLDTESDCMFIGII
jgi:hypothetical protein